MDHVKTALLVVLVVLVAVGGGLLAWALFDNPMFVMIAPAIMGGAVSAIVAARQPRRARGERAVKA